MKQICCSALVSMSMAAAAYPATRQARYYAHPAVEDSHGVIAPWYRGGNSQIDHRVRIAAETLKRYPWTGPQQAIASLPEFVFSGAWRIADDGAITIPPINDWANGDLGQRAAYVLSGLVDYYRYSGDPAAVALITAQADALLDYCQTPSEHPWPRFLISVPVRGRPYGRCDPHGFIQLDIVGEAGLALVRAAQLCGNERWMQAARHWADLLAEKRNRRPGVPPWPRYANPEDVSWEDAAAGGVAFILEFFDALIRDGYTGRENAIVEARQAGVAYLRDVLLPDWTGHDTWGRNYWDWPCPVQVENVTEFAVRYLMEHPQEFPDWRTDARNILTLFLNRTGVAPGSGGDVYSGAWAYPESSACCGRSLWYGPMELAPVYMQYGALTGDEWAREMGRRQMILATYDVHDTGVVEDNIDGGAIVAGDWFKIAHPMALKHCLNAIAWMPELFAAPRENHIVRSASVVSQVTYRKGLVRYRTVRPAGARGGPLDRPEVDVLRLAFRPQRVAADAGELRERSDAAANGYVVRALPGGDYLVTVRHDGLAEVTVEGQDAQEELPAASLRRTGQWARAARTGPAGTPSDPDGYVSADAGASIECQFDGTQVRVIGSAGPEGGRADVYLDGLKQLAPIDTWCPAPRPGHVIYYRSGLPAGPHTLRIVVRGDRNPLSQGNQVGIQAVQYASAPADPPFGEGGGPTGPQRLLFGYPGRQDLIDSKGHAWRPATEFVVRLGDGVDSVAATWYTRPRQIVIEGTDDPELYRYGVHGREFWANLTVGPGTYHVRLKFAETRNIEPRLRAVTIAINGRELVRDLDIAATAAGLTRSETRPASPSPKWAGLCRAVDLVFNGVQPANGVICVAFRNTHGGEAIVQAIEIGPGDGGQGAVPVCLAP